MNVLCYLYYRVVGRSANLGVLAVISNVAGHNLTLLVEIGITDQPFSGGAKTPPGSDRPVVGLHTITKYLKS